VAERELVGAKEVAQMAGVRPGTVKKWRKRHASFPQPVARLARGAVYDREEVAAWLEETGRERR
jgi:predicted DNA-binding transcriptional regulator AlpA